MTAVVIGVGNEFRRDDGVGPAVAAALAARDLPGVRVLTCAAEPAAVLDAWTGSRLAVLVDAAVGDEPGRVRAAPLRELAGTPEQLSSHDLSLWQTYRLGRELGRAPDTVLVVTVGAADTGHGAGLSPAVAAAVPAALAAVLSLLPGDSAEREQSAHQLP